MNIRHLTHISSENIKSKIRHSRLLLGDSAVRLIPPRVIVVHFPKAGGTSLAYQFRKILKSGLDLDYLNDPRSSKVIPRAFPCKKVMVFGHFHPSRYDGANGFRLTFLRNPVDDMISTYFFWKYMPYCGDSVHRRFLKEKPSIVEFCHYDGLNTLMSETYFGGFDMERFDFIGFDESRADDMAVLSGKLGIPLSSSVHLNLNKHFDEEISVKEDRGLRGRLADVLAKDMAFYDRVRSISAGR